MQKLDNHNRVTFFIGGVQKCGTTTLFEYLSAHPQVNIPAAKEVHYFDNEKDVNWNNPDYDLLHSHYGNDDNRLVRGDATPIYIYWPSSIGRIMRYNEDAKLIFLFRDPSERAYSHWKMETARGFDSVSFSWAIRGGRERVDDPEAPNHHRVFSYVERGFYGRQLEHVYSLFPRDRVLNIRSSDLARDPQDVIKQVCRHIGIEYQSDIQEPIFANVGPGQALYPNMTQDDADYLSAIYADDMALFEQISGLKLLE